MKKLFLTTLVAVVAIGGAYATDYYAIESSTNPYVCPAGEITCESRYPEAGDVIVSPVKFSDYPNQPGQILFSAVPHNGL